MAILLEPLLLPHVSETADVTADGDGFDDVNLDPANLLVDFLDLGASTSPMLDNFRLTPAPDGALPVEVTSPTFVEPPPMNSVALPLATFPEPSPPISSKSPSTTGGALSGENAWCPLTPTLGKIACT